ncbi:unnamed protein product [Dracunculus medinensis]|uniref:DNA-directed RNA polymerases I, II, and III subunit RPABC3 n=1 Tax=Dracunculus medinensis TaxID=318479 RepID=A0A158Q2P3_DRAME|nr:unnamed protein product [Dracunculus medinensis]
MSTGILFDDMFLVKDVDPDGKKFDRVSSYPMQLNDKFRLLLTTTLRDDGLPDEREYDSQAHYPRLDPFEYAMFGKVYRIEGDDSSSESNTLAAYASFGGLLMRLKGDANNLHGFDLDSNIYLLMKKVVF